MGERGDYSLLGEAGAGEGEGDYHVLGEAGEGLTCEVPVPSSEDLSSRQASGVSNIDIVASVHGYTL